MTQAARRKARRRVDAIALCMAGVIAVAIVATISWYDYHAEVAYRLHMEEKR